MSAIKTLSKVSGLSKEAIKEIAKSVIENNKKLNACNLHSFVQTDKREFTCRNCNGKVDNTKKIWYELGLKHANNL